MLGAIFLFAGLMKITQTMEVSGQQAADLANLGIISAASPPTQPPPSSNPVSPAGPDKKPGAQAPGLDPRVMLARQVAPARVFTNGDFPAPVKVRLVHGLTLMLIGAAHPGTTSDGAAMMPLWPAALALGKWPVYMAWAATLTETIGGAALLVGFFTRFFALSISIVMLNALWLTQIGPAIQGGKTTLGFLPAYPIVDERWTPLFLQFSLMMSAWALLFLGPGRASLDNLLFAPAREDDDEEAE